MYKGIIISYNETRAFGFIASGSREIFFHASNFQRGFRPVLRDHVIFDIAPGLPGKREQAINVRSINVSPEKVAESVTGLENAMKDAGGAHERS